MSARLPQDRLRRRSIALWVAVALLALALVGVFVVTGSLATGFQTLAPPDAGGRQEGGQQAPPSSTYKPGEVFDLSGDRWMWTGTMRFCVSEPVVYENAAAAGVDADTTDSRWSEWGIVAVDVTIENIDATIPDSTVKIQGAPAILLTMFRLMSGRDDVYPAFVGCSAPSVEGLVFSGHQATSYTWAEPGETIQVRLGYVVIGSRPIGETVSGVTTEEYDASSVEFDYELLISTGQDWGAPVVELGSAVPAGEGD